MVYDAPYYDAVAIVVNTPFTPCRAIYNGSAQDITVTMVSGNSVTLKTAPVGIIPVAATNVTVAASGNLVALY
jgi:hypothetical protein